MEIINRKWIEPFLPLLKALCVLSAFGTTSLLLFKDMYLHGWAEKKETIVYSIPMVFLFFFWIKYKLDEEYILDIRVLGIDGFAIFLVAVRLVGLFFHSGHVLFLVYTIGTTKNYIYRLLCLPMILVTAYFKIFYWGDFFTPIVGAGIALVLIYSRNNVIQTIRIEANNT